MRAGGSVREGGRRCAGARLPTAIAAFESGRRRRFLRSVVRRRARCV